MMSALIECVDSDGDRLVLELTFSMSPHSSVHETEHKT